MNKRQKLPLFSKEQVNAVLTTGTLLKFVATANNRAHDESNHAKIVGYVFDNLHAAPLVHSLINRGITDYDEVIAGVKESTGNPALQEGML